MKTSFIIFVATLFTTALAVPQKLKVGMGWSQHVDYCNRGWGGDGSCEAAGYYTFCCGDPTNDEFQNSKFHAYAMTNGGSCFGGAGTIMCAE
ncbi:hypothetical protein M409DRAFT_15703 [Zasmidium cellare ATCC 36951]|uniref:Uncharacterized protein n=1 Tax=Zasmidium cellare ATCC 36951 TaxID=1080233 RepID=A0A6A6D5K9_ZASCE|nr:uncharacterized protein M409DRAFT_15703 [Zasmidium cellare ATCC 36951]KAF2173419.1 hypothetical protein M409DRAFT_15703 [Zasmidium cellare ATCC 36951]